MSVAVSVKALKNGGLLVQPMGRARGKAISGASPGLYGIMTPRNGMADEASGTR
jgi:hypothetical protein